MEFELRLKGPVTGRTATYFFDSSSSGIRMASRSFSKLCRTLPAELSGTRSLRSGTLECLYGLQDNYRHFRALFNRVENRAPLEGFGPGSAEWKSLDIDGERTSFSPFTCYGNPASAESLYRQFAYSSVPFEELFPALESQIVLKLPLLSESAKRISARLGGRQKITLRELAAGSGVSMAIVLEELERNHPGCFSKTAAVITDGFDSVVYDMKNSPRLARLAGSGKVSFEVDNMLAPASSGTSDYIRLSYALSELPETIVTKESGRYYRTLVSGYIRGSQDITGSSGKSTSVQEAASLMGRGLIQELIDRGIDAREFGLRMGFEETREELDFGVMEEGPLLKSILDEITGGIGDTSFFLSLNAARNLENMVKNKLNSSPGSYIEIFDAWDRELIPGNKAEAYHCGIVTCKSNNLPFIRAYLQAKGVPVRITVEDWSDYCGRRQSLLGANDIYRWMKHCSFEEFSKLSGVPVKGDFEVFRSNFLQDMQSRHLRWDVAFPGDGVENGLIAFLLDTGFGQEAVARLFSEARTIEKAPGAYYTSADFYKVATIMRI